MNIKDVPFTQKVIKDAIGSGEVEFFNFSPNSKSGIKNLEMKIYYPDGQRKVIILHNVNLFNNREERNKEILRLYTEKNLSQAFLANLFGLSQPAISVIIKNTQAEKA